MAKQQDKTLMVENVEELRKIWQNEGSHPIYHRAQQKRLQRQWPMLYNWMVENFGPPKE